MDKRGQRRAIKNAYTGVIRDANRWMLYKELHHLYPCVAATILQCRTKQALRQGAQAKAIRLRIEAVVVLSSSTDEMPEPKLRWRKQVVSLLQRAQQRLYTVEARA